MYVWERHVPIAHSFFFFLQCYNKGPHNGPQDENLEQVKHGLTQVPDIKYSQPEEYRGFDAEKPKCAPK